MYAKFSISSLAGVAVVAALTLGASGAAQAHGDDIFWSIGMSSPGVRIGVSNAPVIYAPPPVVVVPRPVVYGAPMPVYYSYPQFRRHRGWGHERREWEDRDDDRGYRRGGYERGGYDRGEGRGYGGGEYRAAPPLGRR